MMWNFHISLSDIYGEISHLMWNFHILLFDIYGEVALVYNMHNLLHVVDDARLLGALDNFSAFPFESMLGKMKYGFV